MKRLVSGLLMVALAACSADPGYEPRLEPQQSEPNVTSDFLPRGTTRSIEAPHQLVVALQTCADKFAPRLPKSANHYAVQYHLDVDANGIKANVKDSMIPGSDLESCLTKVFEGMEITESMVSTSSVSPTSRSVVGVAQAAAAPIALLPIILVAGGFTILLGVTIYVAVEAVEDVIEAARRRPITKNRCLDAAAGGPYTWREFCNALPNAIDREDCWSRALESEENKRGWCSWRYK